jgi:hypothetical protein
MKEEALQQNKSLHKPHAYMHRHKKKTVETVWSDGLTTA